jgi:hypothetical protein
MSPRRRRGILWRHSHFRGVGLNAIGIGAALRTPGMDSLLPDGANSVLPSLAINLCKTGDETPVTVIGGGDHPSSCTQSSGRQSRAALHRAARSSHPTTGAPEGATSVLSKLVGTGRGDGRVKRARTMANEDEADELGKKSSFEAREV